MISWETITLSHFKSSRGTRSFKLRTSVSRERWFLSLARPQVVWGTGAPGSPSLPPPPPLLKARANDKYRDEPDCGVLFLLLGSRQRSFAVRPHSPTATLAPARRLSVQHLETDTAVPRLRRQARIAGPTREHVQARDGPAADLATYPSPLCGDESRRGWGRGGSQRGRRGNNVRGGRWLPLKDQVLMQACCCDF